MSAKCTDAEMTRRGLARVGGGTALALAMAGLGGSSIVVAQDASPETSPVAGDGLTGRYVVIRNRQLNPDYEVTEVFNLLRESFVPLVQQIPGFVTYLAVADPESQDTAFIGVFADKAGADESNRIAAEWVQANGPDIYEGDPEVTEGLIEIAASL